MTQETTKLPLLTSWVSVLLLCFLSVCGPQFLRLYRSSREISSVYLHRASISLYVPCLCLFSSSSMCFPPWQQEVDTECMYTIYKLNSFQPTFFDCVRCTWMLHTNINIATHRASVNAVEVPQTAEKAQRVPPQSPHYVSTIGCKLLQNLTVPSVTIDYHKYP